MGVVVAQKSGYPISSTDLWKGIVNIGPPSRPLVALVSGHAGFDSGAICTDGEGTVTLTEVEVNASIAEYTAHRLRRARYEVMILTEYDSRLTDLQADLLLSLHSDSCIEESGYKAARHLNSPTFAPEDQFLDCLHLHYAQETGLTYHADTLTHDMLEYHAFHKVAPETPAIILEMGFIGGDQDLLAGEQSQVAKGIADSIRCLIDGQ